MRVSEFKGQFSIFGKSLKKMDDPNLDCHIHACIYQLEQFSDQKNVVIFLKNRMEDIKNEISVRTKRKKKKEIQKAILKKIEKKSRDIPKDITKFVIHETTECPYCFEPIVNGNIDHIYPLKLGGLSISQNLLHCCEQCNNQKAAMTLNEFVDKYNLDWNRIRRRLKEFNKRF